MTTALDQEAQRHYQLVQRGQFGQAVQSLPTFIAAADAAGRPDLCARALAWLGQAHLSLHQLSDARAALRQAAHIAEALGDHAGLASIRALRQTVGQVAMAAAAPPPPTVDTPVARACAALDAGDTRSGEDLATEALHAAQAANDSREEVLAWLALARLPHRRAEAIREAAAVADRASDFNLVTAVAHAAAAAGMPLAPKIFGADPT